MYWNNLRSQLQKKPIFTLSDVIKWFPIEAEGQISVQLSRFASAGQLTQLRNGLYTLSEYKIMDPLILAEPLRQPSYVSLETALNYHGLIPDIPAEITSVSTRRTKSFNTQFGKYSYKSVKRELFFGYKYITTNENLGMGYKIAEPEKALLDYLYLNTQVEDIDELRLRSDELNLAKLNRYSEPYTRRVKKLIKKVRQL